MLVQRHFLEWDSPLIQKAVLWLDRACEHHGLERNEILLLLPTQSSVCRLRRILAQDAGTSYVMKTPDHLFRQGLNHAMIASDAICLAVWTQLLSTLNSSDFSAVFPKPIMNKDDASILNIAKHFFRLRSSLAHYGLDCASTALKIKFEKLRWQQLAEIEKSYYKALHALGFLDPSQAMFKEARNAQLEPSIKRIVLMAVPELKRLAQLALERLANHYPVESCIYAPSYYKDAFDAWGRPSGKVWDHMTLAIEDDCLQLSQDPYSQSEDVVQIIQKKHDKIFGDRLAIGVPDTTVIPPLEHIFEAIGIRFTHSEEQTISSHPLVQFLATLGEFIQQKTYEHTTRILRHPDFIRYLMQIHPDFDHTALLSALDHLQNRHLPLHFNELNTWVRRQSTRIASELKIACNCLGEIVKRFEVDPYGYSMCTVIQTIYEHRPSQNITVLCQHIEEQSQKLDELCKKTANFSINVGIYFKILLSSLEHFYLKSSDIGKEPRENTVVLNAWLDLLWEDAEQLIITGMNDGIVPRSIDDGPFLSNAVCESIEITDNTHYATCDSYLFSAILNSRQKKGSIRLIVGKQKINGEAYRPSRLLFRCTDSQLPQRVRHLFARIPAQKIPNPLERIWQLNLPNPQNLLIPNTLSVTALKDYLHCPFRFYLKHMLKMEQLDDQKRELDALDFGNLCHYALEQLAREESLHACAERNKIEDFLLNAADEWVCNRFVKRSSVIYIQLLAAKERLRAAARIQTQLHQEGWYIVSSEQQFCIELQGMRIQGRIDRIDQHKATGVYRLLDYKSSDRLRLPEKTHLTGVSRDREITPWRVVMLNGKQKKWINLQLPLYLEGARALFPDIITVECAYFNLPKVNNDTGIYLWPQLDLILHSSALACAEGIIKAIQNRLFWPPAEHILYDDFAELFPDTIENAIDITPFITSMQ